MNIIIYNPNYISQETISKLLNELDDRNIPYFLVINEKQSSMPLYIEYAKMPSDLVKK